jgi:hypothetical protein
VRVYSFALVSLLFFLFPVIVDGEVVVVVVDAEGSIDEVTSHDPV